MTEDLGRAGNGTRVNGVRGDRLHSDWSETGRPSTAVVEAVAAATGTAPTELPSLNDHVDPDALDRLLQEARTVEVSFRYGGTEVFVTGDGSIEVDAEAA